MIREDTTDDHRRVDPGTFDAIDLKRHLPVVEQQNVATCHIGMQILVGDADTFAITREIFQRRIKEELVALA